MKHLCLLIVLCVLMFEVFAQDTLKRDTAKTNPIIYADAGFGFGFAGSTGPAISTGLNYQTKHGLFTLRYVGIANLQVDAAVVGFLALPIVSDKGNMQENAILYGWRQINNGRSLSFSLGISYNQRTAKYKDEAGNKFQTISRYAGIPFEANVLWFKSVKKRYRVYFIPVTKPTAFGNSIGFKLAGNISKNSYAMLGIVFGIGYHKHY